ncbi:MAG TPA: HhH-GPD-type base excision DNA repair protein [Acidimicrobiales bacterium]|nr:HhH-GPD-type base excision DNA repair protein [Acidimicrobiales bacterium]
MAPRAKLHLSGNRDADALISRNAFALLVGMVLDQQIPLEWAFTAPLLLAERMGGAPLDAAHVASADPDELAELFRARPALHRFPGSMAARVQDLAKVIESEYGGAAERIWTTTASGKELVRRVEALPGFGAQKAKIFVALLGKQLGVQPEGWREASRPFGEEGSTLSIADITSPETLALVREHKRQMKAAATQGVPAAPAGGKQKAATKRPAAAKAASGRAVARTTARTRS